MRRGREDGARKATLGALLIGSALFSGCSHGLYGARMTGGPQGWGWSVGFASAAGYDEGLPAAQVEVPLGPAERQEFLVVRAGGGMTVYDTRPGEDPWGGEYEIEEYDHYEQDYCVSYRHYFGRGAPQREFVLRPYIEAGLSSGTSRHEFEDGTMGEEVKLNHLALGLGLRMRMATGSGAEGGMYWDFTADYVSRLGAAAGVSAGWSFGRSGCDGLASSAGMRSAGPRMGMVYVSGEAADQLETAYGVGPTLSTIGWQFEYQYASSQNGPTGLVEIIPLVTGLESELSFLSMNVLFGLRSPTEWEFVAGPYISETGYGMTVAAGKTFRAGRMAMPVNLGVTSTREGPRISFTFGWNIGR